MTCTSQSWKESPGEMCWGGEDTPSPKPTLTSDEAEGTEDKVYLVKAPEDWPEGKAHGQEENDTQAQGQHHEARAHVGKNCGGERGRRPQSHLGTLQGHPPNSPPLTPISIPTDTPKVWLKTSSNSPALPSPKFPHRNPKMMSTLTKSPPVTCKVSSVIPTHTLKVVPNYPHLTPELTPRYPHNQLPYTTKATPQVAPSHPHSHP